MYSFKDYLTVDYTGSEYEDELLALAATKRKRADADGTAESVDLENEAIDKNHAIYKEYLNLKKLSINDLRSIIQKQQKIVDVKDYTTKDHAASVIIRHRHGDKRVDAVFGFNENTLVNKKGIC